MSVAKFVDFKQAGREGMCHDNFGVGISHSYLRVIYEGNGQQPILKTIISTFINSSYQMIKTKKI